MPERAVCERRKAVCERRKEMITLLGEKKKNSASNLKSKLFKTHSWNLHKVIWHMHTFIIPIVISMIRNDLKRGR